MTEHDDTSTPPAGAPPEPGPATAPEPATRAALVTPGSQKDEGLLQESTPAQLDDPVAARPPRFVDSYGLVLVLMVATFFATAIGGDHSAGRSVSLILLAATTWLALRASQVQRRLLRLALALIPIVTLVAVVATLLGSDETGRGVGAALTALLVIVAPLAIVKRLASHLVVSLNTFYGAVCVYLLIAMFFASAFALSGLVQGGPFFAQVQPPQTAGSIDYLYFSLITITTVGYGDLTAAESVGRMMAASEAVFGQLYMITVVALVVQNLGQERRLKTLKGRLKK
jgi:hypothetical protein